MRAPGHDHAELARNFRADLETTLANRGTDSGMQIFRPCSELPCHRANRSLHDGHRCTSPSRMYRGYRATYRIGEQDRNAVGCFDPDCDTGHVLQESVAGFPAGGPPVIRDRQSRVDLMNRDGIGRRRGVARAKLVLNEVQGIEGHA